MFLDSFNNVFKSYDQNNFQENNMSDIPIRLRRISRTIKYYSIRTNLIISMLKAALLGKLEWTRTIERAATVGRTLLHKECDFKTQSFELQTNTRM